MKTFIESFLFRLPFLCQNYLYYNILIFTTLRAHSADDKLEIFFWFSPENGVWHFMQTVSMKDSLHEISKPNFWEK